jgi:hypothetical protein
MNRILALRGRAGSGKSTTIRLLHRMMLSSGFSVVATTYSETGGDFRTVFERDGLRIGVSSRGDTFDDVRNDLNWLIEQRCAILVCACRTSDRPNSRGITRGSNAAIDGFIDFQATRLNKSVSQDGSDDAANEANNNADCRRLFDRLVSWL